MTAPSEQNALRKLQAQIKGLPVQDLLVRRRQLFRSAQIEAQLRLAALQTTLDQIKVLRTIQANPNLLVEPEQKRLGTVRAKARELLDLVDKVDAESSKFGEKLDAIKRATKTLSDDVETNWAQVCKDHRDRANVFAPLAERLSPNLVRVIQNLDRLLNPGTKNPPTSAEVVQTIVEARKAFSTEIASLAIDGPIEMFLRDAQNGNGDPKALLDPQVCEYLDAHPLLWGSLRVVLR